MKIPGILKNYPGLAGVATLPMLFCESAMGLDLSPANSALSINLNTTASYGQVWRIEGQDPNNDLMNQNDGNRNFDTGLVSEVFKITSEASLRYRNYGAFIRGTAFYDTQIMDRSTDYEDNNTPFQPSANYPNNDRFTEETRDEAGRDAELLDAYVYGNWFLGDRLLSARLGRQVFNWGEGLFYRSGLNSTNPVDVAKFRLPGSEVKEVLVPLGAISASIDVTESLSAEAFYQWEWEASSFDPVGTFFSTSDLFVPGSHTAYTNSPAFANPTFQATYSGLSAMSVAGLQGTDYLDSVGNFKVSSVGDDIEPPDDGQFGLAFRLLAEDLNYTEFGFYFVNYHDKEPVISSSFNETSLDLDALTSAVTGGSINSYQNLLAAAATGDPTAAAAAGLVQGSSVLEAGNLSVARREFLEDIQVYGASFNTTVGKASVFGEVTYRPEMPIGKAALNDLVADVLAQTPQLFAGQDVNVGGTETNKNSTLNNYEEVELYNLSLGTVYNFGPGLSFDNMVGVAEVASEMVRGSSLKYTAYDGSTRYYAGRANKEYAAGFGRDEQIDRNAFGATVFVSGQWNDVFAGVNLSPYAVYKDDFKGNSHSNGNFIEGRSAYTLGVKASYLASLEAEVLYTGFSGAGESNVSRDRDNIGLNIKYSF
ncbi:DUF1302 domain-containing protein [Marinobacter confluentis]|uniref:DUF1302 domain-containing protein n=2 Tax=Marinobacter confluentis TaxID=1697557 RepID=A0A4Z1BRX9_9GAMM|nr:DUF1302 domain-containing protein [Marinobacter confluentis]